MSLAPDLVSKLMGLSAAERAEVARQMLLSLEPDDFDPDSEALWETELEARAAAVERGEAQASEWREAIQRMRDQLKSGGRP
ncbi:MAG TPA: addiction module protein [Tepidisphaeraceae bacterium]|jgi:hypothetical protein